MMGLRAIQSILFLSIYLYIYFVALLKNAFPWITELLSRQGEAGMAGRAGGQGGADLHTSPPQTLPYASLSLINAVKGTDEMPGNSRILSYSCLWTEKEIQMWVGHNFPSAQHRNTRFAFLVVLLWWRWRWWRWWVSWVVTAGSSFVMTVSCSHALLCFITLHHHRLSKQVHSLHYSCLCLLFMSMSTAHHTSDNGNKSL